MMLLTKDCNWQRDGLMHSDDEFYDTLGSLKIVAFLKRPDTDGYMEMVYMLVTMLKRL
jgi:hypothetical protein